ncbi:uncharacterized protein LOC124921843 [Impatiens glandulifera]|uniref:uncharacterized protein LOC124921843 n=1 Tax=Impatiens glandulifera TaxID=253017 RepID=UPI001FB0C852|nr:uncharacterized protein LOC124921843 [Impatiens glandulifera]
MASAISLNEWEFINDDGFVYKRQKRYPDPTITTDAPPSTDPLAEEHNRKETKKRALMNLRLKYQEEISRWELLSNMLKAMQDKALSSSQLSNSSLQSPVVLLTGNVYHRQLDELLIREECEESIMEDLSNLCDVVESVCSLSEDNIKQTLVNLPIWTSSPQELMSSLCEN